MILATLRQYQPLPANERLRHRLNNFYTCLKDCLKCYQVKDAFDEVCDAICKEADELLEELSVLEEQYQEELPLDSEEPKNVEWYDERFQLQNYCNEFSSHDYAEECKCIESLKQKLNSIADTMERIEGQLCPEDDADIYVSYCKRELKDFEKSGWNRPLRDIRNELAKAPSSHRNKQTEKKLKTICESIRDVSEYIISEDLSTIYYEALGRYLWTIRKDSSLGQKVEDVLCLVKTAEFYSGRLTKKFIFLDSEATPEEEMDEKVRQKRILEETIQHSVSVATFRLGKCKDYFARDFSESFVGEMLTNLLKSEHSVAACDKMSKRKIHKFIHQIAGVFKDNDVFLDCSYGDLVDSLAYSSPQKESRKDYVRHMIDDVPEIQTWIENYIKEYKQKNKNLPQEGVNC